jgi:hypothetical protein
MQEMKIQLVHISGPLRGKIQEFKESEVRIGKGKNCEVQFPEDYGIVSLIHAIILQDNNKFKIISKDGSLTIVNGKIIEECYLREGDVITLGQNGPKISFLIDYDEIEETIILRPAPAAAQMPSSPATKPEKEDNTIDTGEFLKSSVDKAVNWVSTVRNEINDLPLGQILFNPPKEMKVGQTERIVVRISQNLHINLLENLRGKGLPEISIEKVGSFMKVKLTGESFKVKAFNEEGQLVLDNSITEWAWDVLPLKSGAKKLHLLISVRIKLSFGEEKKDFPIIDKDVKVNVNPIYTVKYFISNNWKWLATALILPILGWALKTIMK